MSYKSDLLEHYKQVRARLNPKPAGVAPLIQKSAPAGVSGPTGVEPPIQSYGPRHGLSSGTREFPKAAPLPGLDLANADGRLWKTILMAVAKKHQVDPDLILSHTRQKPIAMARMEAIYRVRTELNYSYLQISKDFDRDHSTVMYAVQKFFHTHIDGA